MQNVLRTTIMWLSNPKHNRHLHGTCRISSRSITYQGTMPFVSVDGSTPASCVLEPFIFWPHFWACYLSHLGFLENAIRYVIHYVDTCYNCDSYKNPYYIDAPSPVLANFTVLLCSKSPTDLISVEGYRNTTSHSLQMWNKHRSCILLRYNEVYFHD